MANITLSSVNSKPWNDHRIDNFIGNASVSVPKINVTGTEQISGTVKISGIPIPSGTYVWFTSIVTQQMPNPILKPLVVNFVNQTIVVVSAGTTYTFNPANAQVTFDPTLTMATTTFQNGMWVTQTPPLNTGNVFLSGFVFAVPLTGLAPLSTVTWSGTFNSKRSYILNWSFGVAVYSSFTTNYLALNVKPVTSTTLTVYGNGDPAGTPEAYKTFLIDGGTGTGGTNYIGTLTPPSTVQGRPAFPTQQEQGIIAYDPTSQQLLYSNGTQWLTLSASGSQTNKPFTTIIYVRTTGSDSNDGTAPTQVCPGVGPVLTFTEALMQMCAIGYEDVGIIDIGVGQFPMDPIEVITNCCCTQSPLLIRGALNQVTTGVVSAVTQVNAAGTGFQGIFQITTVAPLPGTSVVGYILQFTSGVDNGKRRIIVNEPTTTTAWLSEFTAVGAVPGDTFTIYSPATYLMFTGTTQAFCSNNAPIIFQDLLFHFGTIIQTLNFENFSAGFSNVTFGQLSGGTTTISVNFYNSTTYAGRQINNLYSGYDPNNLQVAGIIVAGGGSVNPPIDDVQLNFNSNTHYLQNCFLSDGAFNNNGCTLNQSETFWNIGNVYGNNYTGGLTTTNLCVNYNPPLSSPFNVYGGGSLIMTNTSMMNVNAFNGINGVYVTTGSVLKMMGCEIYTGTPGIEITEGCQLTMDNCLVSDSDENAINAVGASITLNNSTFNTSLTSNILAVNCKIKCLTCDTSGSFGRSGMELYDCTTTLINHTSSTNGFHGILANNGTFNATNTDRSTGTVIGSNVFNGNTGDGINLSNIGGHLDHCTSTVNNGFSGLRLSINDRVGIDPVGSSSNTVNGAAGAVIVGQLGAKTWANVYAGAVANTNDFTTATPSYVSITPIAS